MAWSACGSVGVHGAAAPTADPTGNAPIRSMTKGTTMRLATYNVENMFERARAMDLATWAEGKPILEDYQRLNTLIQEPVYTPAIKDELLTILKRHAGLISQQESRYLILRATRGDFIKQRTGKPPEIVAGGRADWIGWFELTREPVSAAATSNTGRIVGLANADVLGLVEVESRPALARFNRDVLGALDVERYGHAMLIDGNDDRGIDVGLLTRSGYLIESMTSHVDDMDAEGLIFSRDCAEYVLRTPKNRRLLIMLNHFKSKGYGPVAEAAAKRKRQAMRVQTLVQRRLAEGFNFIAVMGDFNDTPDSAALEPLLAPAVGLIDVTAHAAFTGDGRPGTFANGTAGQKIDFLLMSPKLAARVRGGGIERRGVWGGSKGTLFPHLETITTAVDAASDHALLWVDLDL